MLILERRRNEVSELPRHGGIDGHSNRLTKLNLTEQLKRSISRSTKSLHAQTRVRYTACVLLRCGDLFSRTKTLTVPLAKASVPVPPWCRRLLTLPRSHRPTLAWSDAHGSRSSARRACLRASLQERRETTPQLRKKPPALQQAVTRRILEYPLWILACGKQAAHTATKE